MSRNSRIIWASVIVIALVLIVSSADAKTAIATMCAGALALLLFVVFRVAKPQTGVLGAGEKETWDELKDTELIECKDVSLFGNVFYPHYDFTLEQMEKINWRDVAELAKHYMGKDYEVLITVDLAKNDELQQSS